MGMKKGYRGLTVREGVATANDKTDFSIFHSPIRRPARVSAVCLPCTALPVLPLEQLAPLVRCIYPSCQHI